MALSLRALKTRYELKEVIARGGMGVVYKAFDKVMKRPVALKTLLDFSDSHAVQLFRKECEDLASLIHPNIIEIFDVGQLEEDNGIRPYLVMPLLPGTTLDKLIGGGSARLSVERCVDIFSQTCRGLQAAHERGLIHRDLKPSNIFVMDDDSVKIIDFGVARRLSGDRSVGRKGTLLYMSPEQISMLPLTYASDIFSLGVVCYEAVTRRRPFDGIEEAEIADAILHRIPSPAHQLNEAVPLAMSQAIHKAMAKSALHRYRSAKEFADVLQGAFRGDRNPTFDRSRIQTRLDRIRSLYDQGDYEYALEIIDELETEGHVDAELTELKEQVQRARVERRVRQLIETAKGRLQEKEYQIALQKLAEALELDPKNPEALALQSKVQAQKTTSNVEGWFELARTHMANRAYVPARDALKAILQVRPKEPKATQLLSEVDRCEQEDQRLREEKEALYRAALEADRKGDVSTALSKIERVIEMDGRAPEPSRTGTYQRLFDKIRTDHDSIKNSRAEAKRLLDEQKFEPALAICREFLAKYPADTLFQALRYDVEEKQRQAMSARIAETDRQVEVEPDLDRRVDILEQAAQQNPGVGHFERALSNARDKRDMVNQIVNRARSCEERNQLNEALAQWEILNTIYPRYPGLSLEIERLHKRREQNRRREARARWSDDIDRSLEAADFDRALELLRMAEEEFPNDPEWAEMGRVAQQGLDSRRRAQQLQEAGLAACEQNQFQEGIELLRQAYELDENNAKTRNLLVETLVEQGRRSMEADPAGARSLLERALDIEHGHTGATGLLRLIDDQEKQKFIDAAATQARKLRAENDYEGGLRVVDDALVKYPDESYLTSLKSSLERVLREARKRDFEQLKKIDRQIDSAGLDSRQINTYADQIDSYSGKYDRDQEFKAYANRVKGRLKTIVTPPSGVPAEFPPANNLSRDISEAETRLADPAIAGQYEVPGGRGAPRIPAQNAPSSRIVEGVIASHRTVSKKTIWVAGSIGAALFAIVLALIFGHKTKPVTPTPVPASEGTAIVKVSPAGASIFVNNSEVGRADHELRLPEKPGTYQIEARHAGYVTQSKTIQIQAGKQSPIAFALVPENPTLHVLGSGRVFIDSAAAVPIADGQLSQPLAPGEHTVRIAMSPAGSLSFKVTIGSDGVPSLSDIDAKEANPVLVANFGKSARVYGASSTAVPAYLAGKPIGALDRNGLELPPLAPDSYELVLGEGKDAKKRQIDIGPSPTIMALLEADPNVGTLVVLTGLDDVTVALEYRGREIVRKQTVKGQARFPNIHALPYIVHVSKSGYDGNPEQQNASITKGQETDLNFEMRRQVTAVTMKVTTAPGADVFLDDSPAGKAGSDGVATLTNVTLGAHKVEARHKGFETRSKEFRAIEGPIRSVDLTLTASAGTVVIAKNVADAVVTYRKPGEVDGTPVTSDRFSLPEGTYIFSATAPRHKDAQATVVVATGQEARVSLQQEAVAISVIGIKEAWGNRFQQPSEGDWFLHKGESYIGIPKPGPAAIQFVAPLSHGRAFAKDKLVWATHFKDPNNYVLYELDEKELRVTNVSSGSRRASTVFLVQRAAIYTVKLELRSDGISISVNGGAERKIKPDPVRDLRDGLFGFINNREVRLSSFKYSELP